MSVNSNRQQLTAYLNTLQSDLNSKEKCKPRYQAKILQLLISLQQLGLAYDEINKNNIQLQKEISALRKETREKDGLIDGLREEKQELTFEVKAQVNEIAKLEQQNVKMKDVIEDCKCKEEESLKVFQISIQEVEIRCQKEVSDNLKRVQDLQKAVLTLKQEAKRLEELRVQDQRQHMEQILKKQTEFKIKMESNKSEGIRSENKLISEYETKLNGVNGEIQSLKLAFNEQKFTLLKAIQVLEAKVKNLERLLAEAETQKAHYESLSEDLGKETKQKQKQIKSLKKLNSEQSEKLTDLTQENEQLKSELVSAQQKRKQAQKKEAELRKELQQISEEHLTDNQMVNRQKEQLKEVKQEIRKLKEELEAKQRRIKELESSLYKSSVALEDEKKKLQQTSVRIEFIESSNVKLNEKLALEEKNRQKIVKSIVGEKDLLDKQNAKLLQLLEVKESMIRAIIEGQIDLEEPKLIELESDPRTREKWSNLMKQNLRDSQSRRIAIDKWILN